MFYLVKEAEESRIWEAALPMQTSHDALRGHLRNALNIAHGNPKDSYGYPDGPYVTDVFPSHVVYSHKGESFKRSYTSTQRPAGTDPSISLGEPKKVHVAYVDSKDSTGKESILVSDKEAETVVTTVPEGCELMSEGVVMDGPINVREGAVKTIPVKIIKEGWGSMAYYPADVLKRDGPTVFCKGTQMFWNHATESENASRPEGDINNLAAILTKDAEWNDNGPKGAGLYSEAKVFSDYADQVSEKGGHIGLSINAFVRAKEGEIAGRTGRIAEKLVKTNMTSVDFVTKPGAGGAPIVPVQESERRSPEIKEAGMTTDEQAKYDAVMAENKRLKESQNVVLATATVATVLTDAGVQYSQKVLERACAIPVMKEGKVDADWVKAIVADFSEGQTPGVKGMGHTREGARRQADQITEAEMKDFGADLVELGISEAGIKFAIAGR